MPHLFIPEKGRITSFLSKNIKKHVRNRKLSKVADLLFWKSRIFQKSGISESYPTRWDSEVF